MTAKERRKAPRVSASIPIDVLGGGEETSGKTINLSMNGVYFTTPVFIEPLTKVRMGLIVPSGESGEDGTRADFEGVVVRVEPESRDEGTFEYKIAVFITYMSERSGKVLSRFINSML